MNRNINLFHLFNYCVLTIYTYTKLFTQRCVTQCRHQPERKTFIFTSVHRTRHTKQSHQQIYPCILSHSFLSYLVIKASCNKLFRYSVPSQSVNCINHPLLGNVTIQSFRTVPLVIFKSSIGYSFDN